MESALRVPALALLVGCASVTPGAMDGGLDAPDASAALDASFEDAGPLRLPDAALDVDSGGPLEPCTTRITYGSSWLHDAAHSASFDDVRGIVTWDGSCVDDAGSSYAELSNGWRPRFSERGGCLIALDLRGDCGPVPACETRVTYADTWSHAPSHPAQYDDVPGVVTWDGACSASVATLSNGWRPHFTGSCGVSIRYTQCGGLFQNPVIAGDCPDPGVVFTGTEYALVCTSGGAADAFPIRTSRDLVTWTDRGFVFPSGTRPSWAMGDFWAPEIHRVGTRWLAYFSARTTRGSLALGAATADGPLGPYTDLGRPLLDDPHPGVIDVHEFDAPDGRHYLLWKVDGNDVGAPTPIYGQELDDDGVTLLGARVELLRNDRSWEGALIEGPWMIAHDGLFYLFYSANFYASDAYAIGVARSPSPLGPFTKDAGPLLTSNGAWSGPGHGSVLEGPGGELLHVYHAWVAGRVGGPPGRQVLVDRIGWQDGWPRMFSAPSPRSQPPP